MGRGVRGWNSLFVMHVLNASSGHELRRVSFFRFLLHHLRVNVSLLIV